MGLRQEILGRGDFRRSSKMLAKELVAVSCYAVAKVGFGSQNIISYHILMFHTEIPPGALKTSQYHQCDSCWHTGTPTFDGSKGKFVFTELDDSKMNYETPCLLAKSQPSGEDLPNQSTHWRYNWIKLLSPEQKDALTEEAMAVWVEAGLCGSRCVGV